MRAFKLIVNAFILFVMLPIVIAAVLGFALSPLQTSARADEPRIVLEADDVMQDTSLASDEPSEMTSESPEALDEEVDEVLSNEGEFPDEEESSDEELLTIEYDSDFEYGSSDEEQQDDPDEAPDSTRRDHYESSQLRTLGEIYDGDYRYTWYSQRVLPGGGLNIEGRHVSDDGYVVDAQDRIIVASSDLPLGTEIDVPFGNGHAIVLDSGCDSGTLDVYTDF